MAVGLLKRMRYCFKSRKRLGDALFCFPPALYLARSGHQVAIECPERHHAIFDLVSYVCPWTPVWGEPDTVFDTMALDFHFARSKIKDYVTDAFPELQGVPRNHNVTFDRYHAVEVPDYGLPRPYILISPFGYSQPRNPPIAWFLDQVRKRFGPGWKVFCLSDKPVVDCPVPVLTATSVAHLPRLIEEAEEFFTVNSAPSIIAAAVRTRPYYHVWDWGYDSADVDARCNYESYNQIVIDARYE